MRHACARIRYVGKISVVHGCSQVTKKSTHELKEKLFTARKQLEELRKQIKADIISSAEVVVATCISSGELAETGLFKIVLIDEASQSTVPTCLVPLSKGCRQLVR